MSKPLVYKSNGSWWMSHNGIATSSESWVEAIEEALTSAYIFNTAAWLNEHGKRVIDDALARLSIDTPPRRWEGAWP